MNYANFSAKLILLCAVIAAAGCSSSNESENRGGVDGAFSSQAVWQSSCLDSDQFGLTMMTQFEIEGEAFRRISQYHSDGTCSDLSVETIEEGSMVRTPASDGSSSGQIDFNYSRIDITPKSEAGMLALNSVSRCGMNNWQRNETRNVTVSSGGHCWLKTPRTVRDIYFVAGNDLMFGVGSEAQKSGSGNRPTAFDNDRVWKIR